MGLSKLSGFVGILKETIKIYKSKNGKLVANITVICIILITVTSTSFLNMITFFQHDQLLAKLHSPTPPSFTESILFLLFLAMACLLLNLFSFYLYIFAMTSTILASAATYPSETTIFSFKELKMKVKASIKGPIITTLCIYLIGVGFIFMGFCLFGLLDFLIENRSVLLMTVVGILATILWQYLSVVFQLALAVSIIEEGVCGIQAITKARRLVKGTRMNGFLMNIVMSVAIMTVSIPYMSKNQSMVHKMIAAVVISIYGGILAMFPQMFSTVLSQCMKINGESEVRFMGDYEYVKLPYVDQDLA